MSVTSNTTRRIRKGATLPATCAPGEAFLKVSGGSEGLHICITANTWLLLDAAAGDGTVTSVSVVSANGLSGSVANPTTTPAITLDVSGLDAAKIADGSVSNAEFQRLDATSSIQTQLNTKAADADVVHDTGDETIAGVKTFSSDPLIPDEAYGVGWNGSLEPPTKNAVYDKIETLGAGYLVYTALLTQVGTDAPTVVVLTNTLGGAPTLSRLDVGIYRITLTGAFLSDKTWVVISNRAPESLAFARRLTNDVVQVATTQVDLSTPVDDILSSSAIEIRCYP